MINIKVKPIIHNKFEFEVKDCITGKVKQKITAYNIVLDNYFVNALNGINKLTNINLGNGTGTLDITRTTMFSQFASITAIAVATVYAYPTSYYKAKVVLQPADYVGQVITEVGFAGNGYGLTTHALLKDSEGNPISITKTDTDIITVYATIYCVMPDSYMNGKVVLPTPNNNVIIQWLLSVGNGISNPNIYVTSIKDANLSTTIAGSHGSVGASNGTANNTTKTMNYAPARFQVSNGNGFLKTIGVGASASSELFTLNLPNTDVWSGYSVTDLAIGTGDGATQDFDIKCPIINEGSETVKVNGVALTKDVDYTINYAALHLADHGDAPSRGKPKTCSYTELASGDWTKFENDNGNVNYMSGWATIDMQSPCKIGGIRFKNHASSSNNLTIYYSDDNVNWVQCYNTGALSISSMAWANPITFAPPADPHRYWKVSFTSAICGLELLLYNPALHFINPPANAAPVTISYTSPYILKNINYVLDIGFAIQIGRP